MIKVEIDGVCIGVIEGELLLIPADPLPLLTEASPPPLPPRDRRPTWIERRVHRP